MIDAKKVETNLSINVFDLKDKKDGIQSAFSTSLFLNAGYNFLIADNMVITPYFGAGYILHSVKGDINSDAVPPGGGYNYKDNLYYGPSLVLGIQYAYIINEKYQFITAPYYAFYFEPKAVKSFIVFNSGIRMRF